MLKPITEIMNARLVDLDKSQTLGTVTNWAIDPDKKQISALMIKPVGLLTRLRAVATADIVEYGPKMVVIKNSDALVAPHEIVLLPALLRHHQHVIGSPVITASGKKLGNVDDVLFETTDSFIQKIYVQPGILGILNRPDLIIPADKIITIASQKIVVTDDSGNWQTVSQAVTAPTAN
ncbi:MAG: PRC-barrel domain-containing protein [Patescibacteria group bacterium]